MVLSIISHSLTGQDCQLTIIVYLILVPYRLGKRRMSQLAPINVQRLLMFYSHQLNKSSLNFKDKWLQLVASMLAEQSKLPRHQYILYQHLQVNLN